MARATGTTPGNTLGSMIAGRTLRVACGVALAAVLAAGCGDGDDELRVFAAASLTESFAEIEVAFEAENPGVDVVLNFAGSSALREQVLAGAPADVFATANHNDVFSIDDAGLLNGRTELFATNQLQIAVPAGNPASVSSLNDFADPGLSIGLCAEPVPCGEAAEFMLALASVDAAPDTREPDVKSLASKISDGELDAGLVYATDIIAADGSLEVVEIDANLRSRPVVYALMGLSSDAEEVTDPRVERFIDFVMGQAGQRVLIEHGFGGAR